MPSVKAIEQAEFGGVDSRSNPINMPQKRWLLCRNWIPRPDGHLELREGYVIRVHNQTGGGAAYSLTPYTFAAPDSYINPPPPQPHPYSPVTGKPPGITPILGDGTRCALYWQHSGDSQATARISKVSCSFTPGSGSAILVTYQVDSTARFLQGHLVTVAGVISDASSGAPADFFNGTFQIDSIGPGGNITLLHAPSSRKQRYLGPSPRVQPLPPPVPPVGAPHTSVSPSVIDFGSIPANTPTSVSVILTNHSKLPQTWNNFVFSNGQFTITNPPSSFPVTLAYLQSVTFEVTINQPVGSYSATLTLYTSADTHAIPLTATVVAGPGGGNILVAPPALGFGSQTVGTATSPQSVVITNNSGVTAVLNNWAFSNPAFAFVSPPNDPYTLPTGGSLTLSIVATPSVAGTNSGALVVHTDNTSFLTLVVSLEVDGLSPSGGGAGGAVTYSGSGGTMTAQDSTPGPPVPVLVPLTSAGGGAFFNTIDGSGITFPIKGMPISSTALWHYAQGKDGFLYMTNGIDFKFFDGVCFRDVGLPILTASQLQNVQVAIGFSGPSATDVNNVGLAWSSGGGIAAGLPMTFSYAFFDTATNQLAPNASPLGGGPLAPSADEFNQQLNISGLPTSTDATAVGLLAVNVNGSVGSNFLTMRSENPNAPIEFYGPISGSGTTVTCTSSTAHGLATNDVVAIDSFSPTPWPSNGPFAVTVVDQHTFTFQVPNATSYNSTTSVAIRQLLAVPSGTTSITLKELFPLTYQGVGTSSVTGQVQLPYFENIANTLLPASTIGGAQPGYQFYASIYNPLTGHVGNRVPIGMRINNSADSTVAISGLPDFTAASSETQSFQQLQNGGKIPTILLPTSDPEWRILIGRTGDGGEVPYACIDANGAWIATTAPDQTSLNVSTGQIDSNSELPFSNFPPPRSHLIPPAQESFAMFWREGDRMCGVLKDSPFVYRSASELDATTGIFVGDPAQAWDPSKLETFPTAENIIGGYSTLQESWVYTRDDMAQLSELSGEVAWNGPYNWGLVGPFALTSGWNALSFWVSHDRQLCTMLPGGDGPISISTEYERALLSRIGDEFDAAGNPLGYMSKTEVIYFRDPVRLIDCLRIKCVDNEGKPFTVIHDFNLRDDASPYGQAYEEIYLGPLAIDYQSAYIRDSMARARVWATATDGCLYQFYSGGLDNVDYYDGTQGLAYIADAISLRYIGGERTAVRTLEWFGDNKILWYVYENMLNVDPNQNYWVELTNQMRPFPGDAQSAHYIADLQRPEMIHCYLWAQLVAHPEDTDNPSTPMEFNRPPHIPLETYGRLFLAAPWLVGSRGR